MLHNHLLRYTQSINTWLTVLTHMACLEYSSLCWVITSLELMDPYEAVVGASRGSGPLCPCPPPPFQILPVPGRKLRADIITGRPALLLRHARPAGLLRRAGWAGWLWCRGARGQLVSASSVAPNQTRSWKKGSWSFTRHTGEGPPPRPPLARLIGQNLPG